MARISRADREQAQRFILEAINAKVSKLSDDPQLKACYDQAKRSVEHETGYTKKMEKAKKLRDQADKLEKEVKEAVGCDYGSPAREYGIMVNEHYKELIADVPAHLEIEALNEKKREVAKRVFMATVHEELAALIQELSE